LQLNNSKGKWLENLYGKMGLGSPEGKMSTPIGDRIPDRIDGSILREIKSGDVSFSKFTRKQIYKYFWLKKNLGYEPEWHFHGNVTPRVLDKLDAYNIPYYFH
jgi:hypothetical protein